MGSCPPYPLSLGPQLPTAPCVPLASGTPGAQLQVLSHLWSSSPLPPNSTPSLSFSSSLVLLSRSFKVVAGTVVQSNGNTSSSRPVSVIDELGCKQQKSQQKVAQPVRTRPASLTKVQSRSSRVDLETQRCSQGAWLPSFGCYPQHAVQVSPPHHKVATAAPGSKLTPHPHRTKRSREGERNLLPRNLSPEGRKHLQKLATGLLTFLSRLGYMWSKVDFSRNRP